MDLELSRLLGAVPTLCCSAVLRMTIVSLQRVCVCVCRFLLILLLYHHCMATLNLFVHTYSTYVCPSIPAYVRTYTHTCTCTCTHTTQHNTHTYVHTVRDNVVDFKTLGNQVAACVLEEVCVCVCLSVCARTNVHMHACACIVFGGCNVYLTYFACPVINMCSHSSLSLVPPTPSPPPPLPRYPRCSMCPV